MIEEATVAAPPAQAAFRMSAPTATPDQESVTARQLLLAMVTAFLLMCGYSLVKPLRDEVAAAHHESISTLWSGTFLLTLVAVPLFGALASHCNRRRLLTICYRSFLFLFLAFSLLFRVQEQRSFGVDAAFYIWVSVYNLFTLSLFWSVMSDLFQSHQGK